MNRKRNLFISLISAVCAAALVYGIYVLQIRQITLQQTVNVWVPKDFVRAGAVLTRDLLEQRPIFSASLSDSMATDADDVVGQETLLPLGKNEPILKWKLNRLHLLPAHNEATFQIPKEYILSISNGIRAGDKVKLYVSSAEGSGPQKLFDKDLTVASVKSSNNTEIDNPKTSNLLSKAEGDEEKMYISRLETSGPIDQINLNLTEQEWITIDRLCSTKKAKLVVAFSASSIIDKEE